MLAATGASVPPAAAPPPAAPQVHQPAPYMPPPVPMQQQQPPPMYPSAIPPPSQTPVHHSTPPVPPNIYSQPPPQMQAPPYYRPPPPPAAMPSVPQHLQQPAPPHLPVQHPMSAQPPPPAMHSSVPPPAQQPAMPEFDPTQRVRSQYLNDLVFIVGSMAPQDMLLQVLRLTTEQLNTLPPTEREQIMQLVRPLIVDAGNQLLTSFRRGGNLVLGRSSYSYLLPLLCMHAPLLRLFPSSRRIKHSYSDIVVLSSDVPSCNGPHLPGGLRPASTVVVRVSSRRTARRHGSRRYQYPPFYRFRRKSCSSS